MVSTESAQTNTPSRISKIYRTLSDKSPIPNPGLSVRRSKSLSKSAPSEQEEIETRVQDFFDTFFGKHPMSRQEKKNLRKSRM